MSWNKLHETYKKNGIFLALGAGVSVGSQLPNRRDLLRYLVSNHLDSEDDGLFRELENHGFSLPAIASLLEEHSSNRVEFVEHVRDALYLDFPYYSTGITKRNRRRFVSDIQELNPTLRSVASLCAARSNHTYKVNKLIHAIVTFNLDALLQAYVYSKYEKRLLRTIERPSASRRPA